DKQGKFVDGLKKEDFQLKVDGKPLPINFFERVTAGSADEDAQLAAARGGGAQPAATKDATAKPLDRGRTLIFFVDDIHLAPFSLKRARDILTGFVNNEIGQNDQALIASTSGSVGFLQQLTDNKAVLTRAIARLNNRGVSVTDSGSPRMSETQALAIEHNDRETIEYFVEQMLTEAYRLPREMAENTVRQRARQVSAQSAAISTGSLASLEYLVRSVVPLSGRKLVFYMSDGYVLDPQNSYMMEKLRRVTDAAARSGVVIYTMDARGLSTGMIDASSDVRASPNERGDRLMLSGGNDINASQDVLRTLAADTGGRAILNTNAPQIGFKKALQETSLYYLLAWRPSDTEQRVGKFRRIEVSLAGRSDLTVRVRRGFFDPERAGGSSNSNTVQASAQGSAANSADAQLSKAITALYPQTSLPISLVANYLDAPNAGPSILVSLQVQSNDLKYELKDNNQGATVDLAGIVFNDQGKPATSFRDRLEVKITKPGQAMPENRPIFYSYQLKITPGLYQVRVALRDTASGRAGSATQWVEIPDLTKRQLSLSSLLIGERTINEAPEKTAKDAAGVPQISISIDRRFAHTSRLRFVTYIYNAARSAAGTSADVAVQVQVFRDDQPVITAALHKIDTEGVPDPARLPYAAEVPLQGLPAGRYVLQVTVIDRTTKTSASQRTSFEIV
ncbi:MAG: VWA domain-containing protein, partial [Pyrinomonadaceae bacterium]